MKTINIIEENTFSDKGLKSFLVHDSPTSRSSISTSKRGRSFLYTPTTSRAR